MSESQTKVVNPDYSELTQASLPNISEIQSKRRSIKPLYIVVLFFFTIYTAEFILFCLNSRSQFNHLQRQAQILKNQLEQHEKQENEVRQLGKKILDAAQKQERQRFFLNKAEKIKNILNQTNFLQYNQKAKTSFYLALNNFKLVHQNVILTRQINKVLEEQYERLSKIYDFTLPQESFCVVAPTINNVQNYRSEYHLRSILNQNYSNFKVVIIDDASTDHNFEVLTEFLRENSVPQEVILLRNEKRMMATANLHKAATEYCRPEDIMVVVDGDDELLGVNIFKVYNQRRPMQTEQQ